MIPDVEFRRLQWRCRRGLLENDLVLQKFLAVRRDSLDDGKLSTLNDLLALDDNSLWDLLSGRVSSVPECAEPRHQEMLEWLRAC
jgi:succinate dehydrogenase flavin-adding protein (antitoxin of CptAB toxin-antitoxin module)